MKRAPPPSPLEALELEIERAYVAVDRVPRTHLTLFMTTGCQRLIWAHAQPLGTVEVGTYRRNVRLDFLREDVFHAFAGLLGRKHG